MSWAVIDDLQKDRIELETTGLLQLEASLYYIALEAPPGWNPINDAGGGAWTGINDTSGTVWNPINDAGGGAWANVSTATIDVIAVANAMIRVAVGLEPETSRFNVEVNGRKLADIRQDGVVNILDVQAYFDYIYDELEDQDEVDYINNVMFPYMLANPATYQDYYAGGTVWTDITT